MFNRAAIVQALAAVFSVGLVGLLVVSTSNALFTDTTDNPGNSWATGGVDLVDDDSGTAMFTSADGQLTGGQVLTKCIAVAYQGNTTTGTAVKLYGTGTGALAPYLNLRVREGTGGGFGNCAGFTPGSTLYTGTVDDFGATKTNFATGVSTWSPNANPQTRTYEFQITVQAVTAAQNKTAAASYTWEVQG